MSVTLSKMFDILTPLLSNLKISERNGTHGKTKRTASFKVKRRNNRKVVPKRKVVAKRKKVKPEPTVCDESTSQNIRFKGDTNLPLQFQKDLQTAVDNISDEAGKDVLPKRRKLSVRNERYLRKSSKLVIYGKFRKDYHENMCGFCLMAYRKGDKVRVLPCKHDFHSCCADEWICQNLKCPFCSKPLHHTERIPNLKPLTDQQIQELKSLSFNLRAKIDFLIGQVHQLKAQIDNLLVKKKQTAFSTN